MVQPSNPGVCKRRKIRAPPSTSGSISKSSSHTARSRRCAGRRETNRSVGSRRCPSAETTNGFSVTSRDLPVLDSWSFFEPQFVQTDRAVPPGDTRPTGRYTQCCLAGPMGPPKGEERVTKRWKQRPPGSTWGDWGDDDELGRINLLTQEKVLQGVH